MKKILQVILLILIILPLTSKAEENNKYKPEDFEGIWVNTGIVQYGNNKPSINLDYLDYTKNDRSEGSSYDETRSDLILSYEVDEPEIIIEDENQPEENITGYHFGMRTQDNIRGLYFINAWYDDAKPYWHDPLPLIKLVKKDNKMYLKYDLCYDSKCEDNRGGVLAIASKDKLLNYMKYNENDRLYFILEKQSNIKKGQKFEIYVYDTPEVKNSEIIKGYIKKGFNVHFRPWKPNEDITKVVE